MSLVGQWIWRRRRNQACGFWENREGERVGPIPLDEHGRAAFVPSTNCQGAVDEMRRDVYRFLNDAGQYVAAAKVAAHLGIDTDPLRSEENA